MNVIIRDEDEPDYIGELQIINDVTDTDWTEELLESYPKEKGFTVLKGEEYDNLKLYIESYKELQEYARGIAESENLYGKKFKKYYAEVWQYFEYYCCGDYSEKNVFWSKVRFNEDEKTSRIDYLEL